MLGQAVELFAQPERNFSKQGENTRKIHKMFTIWQKMGVPPLLAHFFTVAAVHSKIPVISNLDLRPPNFRLEITK